MKLSKEQLEAIRKTIYCNYPHQPDIDKARLMERIEAACDSPKSYGEISYMAQCSYRKITPEWDSEAEELRQTEEAGAHAVIAAYFEREVEPALRYIKGKDSES